MFKDNKKISDYSHTEKQEARNRYLNAISLSVQGSAVVVMKREVKNLFVNGYNKTIMRLHTANHDFTICIDYYACGQYICGYLTKNEAGVSKLLFAILEDPAYVRGIDRINALASILDKHREVSIQESIYRLLSLPMTKSSVKVKYLPTVHPHFRDGLLKGNIHELPEGESIFHTSSYGYYESRPYASDEYGVSYDDIELEPNYWQDLSAAEFWSNYEIVYDRNAKKANEDGKETRVQTLNDNKGFIRKRSETAVLRYYLNYDNDEDLARGLLVLFHPFRNEMQEIHQHDVRALLKENYDAI